MPERLLDLWPHVAAALTLLLSVLASMHAILYKRDGRATVAWVGLIWLVPFAGAVLYWSFGINRIRRRARRLREGIKGPDAPPSPACCPPDSLERALPPASRHLAGLERLLEGVVETPLVSGNRVEPLQDGDAAYPAMLEAIDGASASLALSSYIFNHDRAGREFAERLDRAARRGVEVRVLIDAVGARYSRVPTPRVLRRRGLRVARFLPTLLPSRLPHFNLRNHRKILVADGRVGFTGGMNINEGAVRAGAPRSPLRDLHFRIEGPVVAQLQETFAEDWAFTTGEPLAGAAWFPPLPPRGPALARAIVDGPDEDFERLRWALAGALAHARSSVRIVTPYFLPDAALIAALAVTAMRGVRVDIVLPAANNLVFVRWASTALLWQMLERGCRVWLSPAPFDHSKLMVVDRAWVLFGSSNWDPRSLRLNFELDVGCHDAALAGALDDWVDRRVAAARPVTLAEVDGRPLPVRLRDGVARLLQPYL
jgi:cardiolipin synthase